MDMLSLKTGSRYSEEHLGFMDMALEEARLAFGKDEVPVGAVLVRDGEVIARAHNQREAQNDPTAHAEILALREAGKKAGNFRLKGVTLYVTLEPCPMCSGAAVLARIDRLVYGATDPKMGAAHTLYNIPTDARLNHQMEVISGVKDRECADLLSKFFEKLRQ